jgi:hypothetical protein
MGLFFLIFDFYLFKVFCFEDLAAIETLDVIDAVPTRDHLGAGMVTSGLHNSA